MDKELHSSPNSDDEAPEEISLNDARTRTQEAIRDERTSLVSALTALKAKRRAAAQASAKLKRDPSAEKSGISEGDVENSDDEQDGEGNSRINTMEGNSLPFSCTPLLPEHVLERASATLAERKNAKRQRNVRKTLVNKVEERQMEKSVGSYNIVFDTKRHTENAKRSKGRKALRFRKAAFKSSSRVSGAVVSRKKERAQKARLL